MVNGEGSDLKKKDKDIDSVNISSVELAKSIINKLPDIREERVKEVKEKYSDLNYEEDAEKIADKILEKVIKYKKIPKLYEDK